MKKKKYPNEYKLDEYEKKYPNAFKLDAYEQDIEDNLDKMLPLPNMKEEMAMLQEAARLHNLNKNKKKPITLRVPPKDLESMRVKAYKLGIS